MSKTVAISPPWNRAFFDPDYKKGRHLTKEAEHWSLTTIWEKLVEIGVKVLRHGRYVTFQLAEVAVSKSLFQKILASIDDVRRRPASA